MEKAPKIYAGNGKKQSENWFKVSLNFTELEKYVKENVEEYKGNKYVKVNINVIEPDKFGNTISVTIDTWKPTNKANTSVASDDASGLPF